MKYKHTIELITKDFQDLTQFVDKFKDYPSIPNIELELVLSKLRNIYDILLMLKNNNLNDISEKSVIKDNITETETDKSAVVKDEELEKEVLSNEEINFHQETVESSHEDTEVKDESVEIAEEKNKKEEESAELQAEEKLKSDEKVLLKNREVLIENIIDNEADQHAGTLSEEKTEKLPVREKDLSSDQKVIIPEKTTQGKDEGESLLKKEDHLKSVKTHYHGEAVLGEKFKNNKTLIYEKLGSSMAKPDLSSKLQSNPIKSIAGSIGLNDKFYYTRELFKGSSEEFSLTIGMLDNAHNFNEAYNYLMEHFDWDMESEAVQSLLSLIRRKFITGNNE